MVVDTVCGADALKNCIGFDPRIIQPFIRLMVDSVPPSPYAGVRVLIADDSLINRRLGKLLLEMSGCTVTCVPTGFHAVETFRKHAFDLVLMDYSMPGLDGCAAAEMIRKIECTRGAVEQVPIVAISAFALPGDRDQCIRCGMNDFLTKPLRKEMILDVLSRLLPVGSLGPQAL